MLSPCISRRPNIYIMLSPYILRRPNIYIMLSPYISRRPNIYIMLSPYISRRLNIHIMLSPYIWRRPNIYIMLSPCISRRLVCTCYSHVFFVFFFLNTTLHIYMSYINTNNYFIIFKLIHHFKNFRIKSIYYHFVWLYTYVTTAKPAMRELKTMVIL